MFGNFPGEGEAAFNVLGAAGSNRLYGVDIGVALGKSMSDLSHITRDHAALNWMMTPNFSAGKAMDITKSEKNGVRYQQRGYAKYIEIAALFRWDTLVLRMSMIHFLGVQPVDAAALAPAMATANLPRSALIYDRLKHYQLLIPMDNPTFKTMQPHF